MLGGLSAFRQDSRVDPIRLQYVRLRIHTLKDGDTVFATRENFTAFMMTLDSFADLAEVKQSGAINIDVNVASDNVSIFL